MVAIKPSDGTNDPVDRIASALRRHAEPLPAPEQWEAFGQEFDRFGDASVVLLGASTHGTSEFHQARTAITRRLIERHGFTLVCVEADWQDAARVDDYARHGPIKASRGVAFRSFPPWMWRNQEVMAFAEWMRSYNRELPVSRQASFHGLDVYSLCQSAEAVLSHLTRVDPEAAAETVRRYGCLSPWQDRPAPYGRSMAYGGRDPCEGRLVAQLCELLTRRLTDLEKDGEAWLDAAQRARIVREAERYYRIMYRSSTESWNLRDRHMFDMLQALIAHRGPGTKALVWAHNVHVGNAAATSMGWQGQFNVGQLCRLAHRDKAVLIGFGTDSGSFAAASDWGAGMAIRTLRPARQDSYEHAFREAGAEFSLTDWRSPDRKLLAGPLRGPLLERAVGAVYRPDSELLSHYFEAVLSEQFDAFVWFDSTTPVVPVERERPHGGAEADPFGR